MKNYVVFLCLIALAGSSFGIVNVFTGAVDEDWSKVGNWSLGELPGATATNHAVVQTGFAVLTNDFAFSNATLTIIRGGATLNISANVTNSSQFGAGLNSANYGFINQTAGTVSTATAFVGNTPGTAAADSVYTLSGGSLVASTVSVVSQGVFNVEGGALIQNGSGSVDGNGQLNVNGGTYTVNQGPANITISGSGLIKVQSGTFEASGTGASDLLTIQPDVEVSGGVVDLNGQTSVQGGFRVVGNSATISLDRLGTTSGTSFAFDLVAEGVSPVSVAQWMALTNASLAVDGSAYTGGATNFVLMESDDLSSMFEAGNISVSGLSTASVAQVGDSVVLSVTESQTPVYFENTIGDGLWGTAGNWSSASVPSGTVNAVVDSGLTAAIASNAPDVKTVTVGDNTLTGSTLIVQADLTVGNLRAAAESGATGHVLQSNGVGTVDSVFQIASTDSGADTGTYTISGGTLLFSNVTLSVGTQGTGLFSIEGSAPSLVGGGSLELGAQGTLLFELDTQGVTPLTLTGDVTSSGQVVVDGTDYEGMDGYFPLILSSSLTGSATNDVALTGFGAREPALVLQSDGLWLRLIAPPSLSERLCSLVPDSTVAVDWSNTVFAATREYDPSGSAWSVLFDEAHVLDTTLMQAAAHTNQSWELRTGRGGFIYSLRTGALGETVPPSYRSDGDTSPWNDEVWQGVAVGPLNDPPDSPYFMHQSGVYLKDPAVLTEPFYSPQVAAHLDETDRSFTTVNWTPQAHINIYTNDIPTDNWKSYLLAYTRYRDLGQGIIEVSLGYYNYGPDHLNWFNMPWGGVRRTSTEYAFVSRPGGTTWSEPVTEGWGTVTNFDETGGWMGYSATTNGVTPALGFVFGEDAATLLPNQISKSWFRWGYAGGTFSTNETSWRNYFVTTAVRRYNLSQGEGIWSRSYFALGDDMQDLSDRIEDRELVDVELSAFNYTEATTPLVAYSVSGSGTSFQCLENGNSPDFFLYAHPVSNSFPVFEIIEDDNSRYLTWNPYANGIVKPYDGTIAGMRLLGFAMDATNVNYTYELLANQLPGTNYMADGETLYVRTATPIETWRVEYFGVTDDAGDGANTANPDSDTAVNLWEYGFGGDPTNAADIGYSPSGGTLSEGGTNFFEYTYPRRIGSTNELDYYLELTTDLVNPGWTNSGYVELPATGTIDADFESVTNRIDTTGKTNEFIRLRIKEL